MNTLEPGHFLMSVINGAEDIEVFLDKYNACHADDVLRSGVEFDDRPLVIVGSEKRHMMCKRKLPIKFKELNRPYDESKIHFITESDLKEFVTNALADIRGGVVENPDVLQTSTVVEKLNTKVEEVKEELSAQAQEESEEVLVQGSQKSEYEQEQDKGAECENTQIESTPSNTGTGLCRYGVPKFKVDYIVPQVMGLRESLFVNVEEEDLNKFFASVKGRVLTSINKDI